MNKLERENLGVYYRRCLDFSRGHFRGFDPLSVECFLGLLRTVEMMRSAVDSRMRRHNLTGPSMGILSLLETAPDKRLTMRGIGEQMLVSQPNVTGIIDTLEAKGFVERKADPEDRRIRYIRITKEGTGALRRVLPHHLEFLHSLFRDFARQDKSKMIRKLQDIRSSLVRCSIQIFLIIGLTVFALGPLRAQEAKSGITLGQCYDLALKASEGLQAGGEAIYQFRQRVRQALAAILPKVNFLFTEFWQDTTGVETSGGVGGTLTLRERPEGKFQARQPIFSGFREFHAMKGIRSEERRQAFDLKHEYLRLYENLANVFYLVVQLEKDLENTRTVLKLSRKRIKDLGERARLGKTRRSEVLSAESQLATLEGEEKVLMGQVAVAREVLSFLCGRDMQNEAMIDEIQVGKLDSLPQVLERALRRSDLLASLQAVETKKQTLKAAKGALFPTVSLFGNTYVRRTGFQEPIDWDLLLSVDVPLFQGGAGAANIRLAQSEMRQAQWEYQRVRRDVESAVRKSHINLKTVYAQAKAFETAFRKARESYRLQVKEYSLGIVNNLDVLEALTTLQKTKRDWDRTVVQTKLNYLVLRAASEDVPQAEEAAKNSKDLEMIR